jgi:hypothetical protein
MATYIPNANQDVNESIILNKEVVANLKETVTCSKCKRVPRDAEIAHGAPFDV